MTHNIRPAEPSDLPHFAAIEQAAGALFSEAGLPEIAAHEPTDIEFIEAAARTRAVFVHNSNGGYECPHLDEQRSCNDQEQLVRQRLQVESRCVASDRARRRHHAARAAAARRLDR